MRNNTETKIKRILALTESLPYFTIDDLVSVEKNKNYLKNLFSRQEKKGALVRLKKGVYVTERYFHSRATDREKKFYREFLANILYKPSYLSLEYVLYRHNLITEIPVNFTSVSINKTACFSNKFGRFFYHKIKGPLFCGFDIVNEGGFTILKAAKAKALFDFLYFRKSALIDEKSVEELRLNPEGFLTKDARALEKYINMEGSRRMKDILNLLVKLWKH